MGKKGGSKHLKRKPAPRFWPIHRKEYVWTLKPKPGPHSLKHSLPLAIIIREILGFAKTRKEAKTIISKGKVLVDGKIRREEVFPVGLMDAISIPDAEATYRILSHKKGLILHPVEKDEATFKLCRIENKTVVNHGHVQLSFHDGTNKLIQVADPKNPEEDVYQTLDVIKVAIPSGEITGQIKLAKDATALIIGGKNRGTHGKIVDIEEAVGKKRRSLLATIEDAAGKRFQTTLDYVFIIGDKKQSISLPEVE
ncbi:MAG: 30S ribosomal protein S4e [Candidatus Bathyarchaeota archaeon]|nr:30S ribosomal protein S4e [Candidatus Bathyarchaeota archaeon]MDH5494705.1 30S ribosomal protein S4e [Candidatus Bathyarchaeota archaeon]